MPRFPRQLAECAGQDDACDRRIPVAGGIERDLHCPEAVALEHDGAEAERPRGDDGGLDIAAYVEEVVGVHVIVVLARADAEGGVSFGR